MILRGYNPSYHPLFVNIQWGTIIWEMPSQTPAQVLRWLARSPLACSNFLDYLDENGI